ncbi:molybdopterin converting factor subunit 1 [Rheinheimera texasensis]|uniref:molybdopterin converting factor subunit 1 n=1 Tax=Rheinheimera texasensis TaxID=306205 RepID=UPI0004E0DC32|nr:molybdopterin converting factor subunit 1 [Rheinheimera texasensis]
MVQTLVTQVLFFASLREAMKIGSLKLTLTKPVTVQNLLMMIAGQSDRFAAALAERELLVAINEQLADQHSMVQPGDTIALFPPVTGG